MNNMTKSINSTKINVSGVCKATHVCKTKSGLHVPLSYAVSDETREYLNSLGKSKPKKEIVQNNLVVNTGRAFLAKALGGFWENQTPDLVTPYINRIALGTGLKTGNLPNLSDTGLVQELERLDGTAAGTFLLTGPNDVGPEIVFPASVARTTGTNAVIAIDGTGVTTLTDGSADFITDGVQLTDQVTLSSSPTNPLVLGVRSIQSSTVLELHNPNGFAGSGLAYSVDTPGTQVLISKLISGNTFTQVNYGVAVLIKEAALLFNNDTMFNRVVFAPSDEDAGLLLQSDEANGVEIGIRFEWLVTL